MGLMKGDTKDLDYSSYGFPTIVTPWDFART